MANEEPWDQTKGFTYYQSGSHRLPAPAVTSPSAKQQHVCPHCGVVYRLRTLLKRHVQLTCKRVPRTDVYQCNSCAYRSSYKANIERHVRNLHDNQVADFKCQLCQFRSKYAYCVRRHMRTFHAVDVK